MRRSAAVLLALFTLAGSARPATAERAPGRTFQLRIGAGYEQPLLLPFPEQAAGPLFRLALSGRVRPWLALHFQTDVTYGTSEFYGIPLRLLVGLLFTWSSSRAPVDLELAVDAGPAMVFHGQYEHFSDSFGIGGVGRLAPGVHFRIGDRVR